MILGKLCLVTGGSGTIGVAIAKALVAQGADVVMTGRSLPNLEKARTAVLSTLPSAVRSKERVRVVACDVTIETKVEHLFDAIDQYKDHSSIAVLINNAGTNAAGATVDLSASDFQRVMNVNVLGPFLCSREAMKRMKTAGGGRIINIGSLSAKSPRADSAPYTASKFALLGLTHSLSVDGRAHNIAASIVHPGNVQSELLTPETIAERQCEGFLQPVDVAECVVNMAASPLSVNILEITILPTQQPMVGRG